MVNNVASAPALIPSASVAAAPETGRSPIWQTLTACRNTGEKMLNMAIKVSGAGLTGAVIGACTGAITGIGNHDSGGYLARTVNCALYGGLIAAGVRLTMEAIDLFTYKYSADYHPENDGKFPLCFEGKPLLIKYIVDFNTSEQYAYSDLIPYLSTKGLAARYHARIAVETYTEQDLPADSQLREWERGRIGQEKVMAKTAFREGECLGIYGGDIIFEADIPDFERCFEHDKNIFSHTFNIDDTNLVIGKNIISRVDNISVPESEHDLYHQIDALHNTKLIFFSAITDEPKPRGITFPALFASKDIAAGEELRSIIV